GKPCEGEPHARFDEGRMKISSAYSTKNFRDKGRKYERKEKIDSSKNIRISEDEHGTENFAI
ncbi:MULTISPECIES: hypothetical protein, partial [unclassified Ruminococcus]